MLSFCLSADLSILTRAFTKIIIKIIIIIIIITNFPVNIDKPSLRSCKLFLKDGARPVGCVLDTNKQIKNSIKLIKRY